MGFFLAATSEEIPTYAVVYLVAAVLSFVPIQVYLGERLATRSLLPVVLLAAMLSIIWPVTATPLIVGLAYKLRHGLPRRARVRYRHVLRVLLRRKARLRRAGEAFYQASAARLAARTATTGRHLATAGSSSLVQSPLTRYCSRCRKNVPIVAVYCTRCGRKFDS
jgi:hypothetical protein